MLASKSDLKLGKLVIEVGIVPSILFRLRLIVSILIKLPSSSGNDPDNSLSKNIAKVNLDKFPNSGGISPDIKLFEILNCSKFVRLPICGGITPVI